MNQKLIDVQTQIDWHSFHLKEWINGSAISPELTHKWLEHYSNKDAIAALLGWKSYHHTPGWAVRSVDPLTGNRTNSGQFKPNEPLLFPDSGKPAKYFSFPKNGKSDPLFSVMVLNEWVIISENVGVPIDNEDIDENCDDLGFWRWVIKNPTIPIVITEGAKKAASLLNHGHVTIALAGVWNGQLKKKLHPILKHFLVSGRRVYLAFDADVVVKENVEAALKLFGSLCEKQNTSVYIVQWVLELGKGVDDLIVKGGVEAFRAAMEQAHSYTDWRQSLEDKYRAACIEDEDKADSASVSRNKKKNNRHPQTAPPLNSLENIAPYWLGMMPLLPGCAMKPSLKGFGVLKPV